LWKGNRMTSKGRLIDLAHSVPVIGIYLVLVLFLIILAFINPSFFGIGSITNLIGIALPLVFVSMAQTIVVLVKGIDLSIGPSVSLTTVFCASLMSGDGHNMLAVIVGALLTGILIGIINGGLVVLGRLQPIIVTLAMSSILTGISLFIMPQPGGTVPGFLNLLVTGDIGFLPVPFIVLIVVSVAIWWPIRHSQIGQGLYAIGGNELGAYYSGVRVKWVTWMAFIIGGLLAAIAGVALTAQALSGDPLIGGPYTLNSIAAVVLGGTSLAGGKGGIVGSIAGALVLSIIVNILFFLGVSAYYQYVFSGLIVIIALAAVSLSEKVRGIKLRGMK
jgi:ribose transport system permease protein